MKTCEICGHCARIWIEGLYDDRYGAPGRHALYRCESCGFAKLTPGLTDRQIPEFYSRYYPLKSATAESVVASAKVPRKLMEWWRGNDNTAHWYVKKGQSILDIGCASGLSLLEARLQGAIPSGVEPDPNARIIADTLGLRVFTGMVTDNPFPGEKFDLVTANQVIEHIPDSKQFMKAVAFRIETNGTAVFSFPNPDSLYRKFFGKYWINWHAPYHINFFTLDALKLLTASEGLKVKSVRTITPNLWTILQFRMFKNMPPEGVASPHWTTSADSPEKKASLVRRAARRGLLLIATCLIALCNRVIDATGQGDSFLVTLEHR